MKETKPLRLEHLSAFDIDELKHKYPYLYQNCEILKTILTEEQPESFYVDDTNKIFWKGFIFVFVVPLLIFNFLFLWKENIAVILGPIAGVLLWMLCFSYIASIGFSLGHWYLLKKSNLPPDKIRKTFEGILFFPWSITNDNELIQSKWLVFIHRVKINFVRGWCGLRGVTLEGFLSEKYILSKKNQYEKYFESKAFEFAEEYKDITTRPSDYTRDEIAFVMKLGLINPDLGYKDLRNLCKQDKNRPKLFDYKDDKKRDERLYTRVREWVMFARKEEQRCTK